MANHWGGSAAEQIINAMVRRSRARRELLFRLVGRYAAGLERLWS